LPFKSKEQRKLYMRQYRAKRKAYTDLQSFLNSISGCSKCQNIPSVFATEEKIPLCQEHWHSLADSDIEWNS